MKKAKQDWAGHVAALKDQGISTTDYARQHGLGESSLYRWKSKLQRVSSDRAKAEILTAPAQPSKFITLRLSEPQRIMPAAPTHCTLVLSGGMRLEIPALPAPQWLAELGRCTQGAY
jgi:lambda repressor-like predicted transcriptional regulator